MEEVDPITAELIQRELRGIHRTEIENHWLLLIIAVAAVAIAVKIWFFA